MPDTLAAWHDFYVMAGGALAALTGLLFVAMSIHLKEILRIPNLTQNVAVALYGMLSQLLFCGLMLVPGLTLTEAGIAVVAVGGLFAAGYFRFGKPRNVWDSVSNAGMGAGGMVIGIAMIAGWTGALYLYAVVLGTAVIALVRLCWMLLTMAITGLDKQRETALAAESRAPAGTPSART